MTRVQAAFLYGSTSKDKIGSELASEYPGFRWPSMSSFRNVA